MCQGVLTNTHMCVGKLGCAHKHTHVWVFLPGTISVIFLSCCSTDGHNRAWRLTGFSRMSQEDCGGAHEEAKILKIPCDRSSFNPEIKVGTSEFAVYTLLLGCSDPMGHFVPFINACRSIKSSQQAKLNVLFWSWGAHTIAPVSRWHLVSLFGL